MTNRFVCVCASLDFSPDACFINCQISFHALIKLYNISHSHQLVAHAALGDDQTIGVTQTCVDRTKPNLSKADCDVGDDALLTCTVNESIDRTYKLSWWWNNGLDDSEPLNLVVGSQVSIPDNRFNVTENHRTNSLQVSGH